ncbi:MAG: tRNA 5-hydroxyuridine modification protein YegQ [Thiotrichaceae bacterium]|nr:tRNA 5-hydroxyuridine modification protein YegQ [Thiotrichaceae bacterium]
MKRPELLAPAGNLRNLRYALAYGADAVYAGQPRYSLRVRNNDFNKLESFEQAIQETHAYGKKFYVAANLLPHNNKLKTVMADLEPVIDMQPDALIMADPGLIMMIRERWPHIPVHLSVQANTMNYASVKFWQQLGLTRIILSRELSLEEIAEIRQQCPDIELEVFVHGALCIAYSGRCLLSGYMNHRDPNQGACTNACRWDYKLHEGEAAATGEIVPKQAPQLGTGETQDGVFLLEERTRPDELMPIFEDEHGTYIMNSKDLRAVQHVHKLTEMGIDSLKIEGRTKSHYYVARTAQVYQQAIDDAVKGKPFDKDLMDELEKLANRGYTEGFYRRHVHDEYQNYTTGNSLRDKQLFVGEIIKQDSATGLAEIEVKNKFELGDTMELMSPEGNIYFKLEIMQDEKGNTMQVAPGSGYTVYAKMPVDSVIDKSLLLKNMD